MSNVFSELIWESLHDSSNKIGIYYAEGKISSLN